MSAKLLDRKVRQALGEILGYINFSSGASDANFLRSLNYVFGRIESSPRRTEPAWRILAAQLHQHLELLRTTAEPFRRAEQAEAVLSMVFDQLLPAYRQYHRDLLFHHSEESLFRPLFIGRVIEVTLRQGSPWAHPQELIPAVLKQLNDYVGYRPVPVLETEQKMQPYDHEWVRPIPLYIRGVGVGVGPYARLVAQALEVLERTDPEMLQQAHFCLELLDELALDPRAYDFDHPAAQRPHGVYGEWDLRQLDDYGQSRRFVVRHVMLEGLLDWVQRRGRLPYSEALFDAGAVLAGTMLMGAAIGGNRPDAHDSTVTLASLVHKVAEFRDSFYQQLLHRLAGPRRTRLEAEAVRLKQPFGGARQHLNQYVARLRAEQTQHLHLADVYSRLGANEEAICEAEKVRTASVRMRSQIYCRLDKALKELSQGNLHQAAAVLPELEDLLHRAIHCGAFVDPWCVLGFAGQFPLFPFGTESVHDDRVDQLIEVLTKIFGVYARLHKEAAAWGDDALQQRLADRLHRLAKWWDKYATTEVSGVSGFSGLEVYRSAQQVAAAVRAWQQAGAAAGDVAFWRQHAEQFSSQTSYALVLETLMDHGDLVAAMALLVHWLSHAATVGLWSNENSFFDLCRQWMEQLWKPTNRYKQPPDEISPSQRWALSCKFIDYLEANADELAKVPSFALADNQTGQGDDARQSLHPEELEDQFGAAYEGVTYRDSADDGFDEEMLEAVGDAVGLELVHEAERIGEHLQFLLMLADLRHAAAMASLRPELAAPEREEVIAGWVGQTEKQYLQLLELANAIRQYRIARSGVTFQSLQEYDRHWLIKENLLEHVVDSCVEMADTLRMLRASMSTAPVLAGDDLWEQPLDRVLRAAVRGDTATIRRCWDELVSRISGQPLQYIPLWKSGDPMRVAATRSLVCALQRLAAYLPRLGMLQHTLRLLEAVEEMEITNSAGPGAVTEFDKLFFQACRGMVCCLALSAENWSGTGRRHREDELIAVVDNLLEVLHRKWVWHSEYVRLSVLETVASGSRWETLTRFIKTYGEDLFTQQFLQLSNLRAILHQGAETWLRTLLEDPEAAEQFRLLRDLKRGRRSCREAARWLTVILEAVVEHYTQYADYNSTTTQSDRGTKLYMLLDFLRLLERYRRLEWYLRPVEVAHEALVRCQRYREADIWADAVAERSAPLADKLLTAYARLRRKYGMHLRSVADRLEQRLVRPLEINRLRGLVRAAAEELRDNKLGTQFANLKACVAPLAEEASGSGFQLPSWLEALREEVERCLQGLPDQNADLSYDYDPLLELPQARLSLAQVRKELRAALGSY